MRAGEKATRRAHTSEMPGSIPGRATDRSRVSRRSDGGMVDINGWPIQVTLPTTDVAATKLPRVARRG